MTSSTIDPTRVQEFTEQLFGTFTGGMLSLMIDLGHRTGLFEAAAAGPATSSELAERAGLRERYVREWLGAMVTGGIIDYDPATDQYLLPVEHGLCLQGDGPQNLAPLSQFVTLLARTLGKVATAFRQGGGVPFEAFRPEFTSVMDGSSRLFFDAHLVDTVVPMAGDLEARLSAGIRVADIGCGSGHSTNVLAAAFGASTFFGYDFAADAVKAGRTEAADLGLDNVTFENLDITALPSDPPFEAVVGFDAIHDLVDPVTVLERVFQALVPGGTFLMVDIKASSDLEENRANPLAPWLYSISTLHCLTVSLSQDGAGLGTVWGEQLARQMLGDAGFVDISQHDFPDDPVNSVYIAYKPG